MSRHKDIETWDVLQEALRVQRDLLREMVASRALSPEEAKAQGIVRAGAEDIATANKTIASLAREARAMTKDNARWLSRLSPEEKRQHLVEWARDLPRRQQRQLMVELAEAIGLDIPSGATLDG